MSQIDYAGTVDLVYIGGRVRPEAPGDQICTCPEDLYVLDAPVEHTTPPSDPLLLRLWWWLVTRPAVWAQRRTYVGHHREKIAAGTSMQRHTWAGPTGAWPVLWTDTTEMAWREVT